MRIFDSRPALRWFAPMAFLLVIGGTGLVAATATADNKLPARTAQELLVDLQQSKVDGLSGTVVQRADLGIPAIPGAGGRDSSEFTSLVSGTHTLRVKYAAPDKMRLAVMGTYGESDVIRNGADVWTWSSKDQSATHRTMSADERPSGGPTQPSTTPKTPQEVADQVLKALEPSTTITTDSAVTVAGRAAYELVMDPNDAGTLVSEVRIAIDGETKQPLRVQMFGAGDKLAFEVGYTSVSFTRPDDAEFTFNPPPGTKVTEAAPEQKPSAQHQKDAQQKAEQAKAATKVIGKAWTTVVVLPAGAGDQAGSNAQLEGFLQQLPKVSGTWGSGRLLAGTMFSAVLTDDGRIAMGAVSPDVLYRALG